MLINWQISSVLYAVGVAMFSIEAIVLSETSQNSVLKKCQQ